MRKRFETLKTALPIKLEPSLKAKLDVAVKSNADEIAFGPSDNLKDLSERGLNKVLWTVENAAKIFASDLGLESLPLTRTGKGTFQLAWREINFSSNPIRSLPIDFGHYFRALTHLDLSDCDLTDLPSSVGSILTLEELILDDNKLVSLPPDCIRLTKLRVVSLVTNCLTHIPEVFENATNLETINMSENSINSIATEFEGCSSLETLDLSSNKLQRFPLKLEKLSSLRHLRLRDNKISYLPGDVGELKQLVELDLWQNMISDPTHIPDELAELSQLTHLDLNSNQLKVIPEPVLKLPRLEKLFFNDNKLEDVTPQITRLTSLLDLDISQNKLSTLPTEMSQMTWLNTLDASRNIITSIPREFGFLTRLQKLQLWNNNLTELSPLLCHMTGLVDLDLNGNSMTEPPQQVCNRGAKAIIAHMEKQVPPDFSKTQASGDGLHTGVAGKLSTATIDTFDDLGFRVKTGKAQFECHVIRMNESFSEPDQRYPPLKGVRLEDCQNGQYLVHYNCSFSANYHMIITHDKTHIPGSPFALVIEPSDTEPAKCVVTGDALAGCTRNVECELIIQAKDRFGNNRKTGGDDFDVIVKYNDGNLQAPTTTDITNGTYFFSFVPSTAGLATLEVKGTGGVHVVGSPFQIAVR